MAVYRLFTEKKPDYDVYSKKTEGKIRDILGLNSKIRFFIRYDIEGITKDELKIAANTIFSEPPVDFVYYENLPKLVGYTQIGIEFLPGQYDQRADSAAQCVQLLTMGAKPVVRCASIYAVKNVDESGIEKIKKLLINPVECRICGEEKPADLSEEVDVPEEVNFIQGFRNLSEKDVIAYHHTKGFAMSVEDLFFVRDYFIAEKRDPTETELKVIDTYWSDHCRHTTFFTKLDSIDIKSDNPHIHSALNIYSQLFDKFNSKRADKCPCLMDIATIGVKELKAQGRLKNLDESEEINACSINVSADIDGRKEDWLVMFKNETHNHPTEIEPYGGAATCLGGAIRDPLSGRAYVYQAMRVSGAGDIGEPLSAGLKGKLPQRVISLSAAAGFSSYGNQIGLATGLVHEFIHQGFRAKRMEVGFVVAAAKKENVVRERPVSSDIILLIGGETGRDGCGGATGSSKAHDVGSIEKCGAEVQKGNPLTERKLQRLFKNPHFSKLVKRCNDFGAGGVSVAIGELADSLQIELDTIPKKYHGLGATELAISESQERMAVVVREADLSVIEKLCAGENVAVTRVAKVTDNGRIIMRHNGNDVVNLSRKFLDTNGVRQSTSACIADKKTGYLTSLSERGAQLYNKKDYKGLLLDLLSSPSVCSQKGLTELFDSTIGAGTVLMPLGGKYQLTPSIAMVAKLPVMGAATATVASFGYNPDLMNESCFIGAVYSVLESVTKAVITGAKYDSIYLSFQEYFEKLRKEPARWGKPTSALLGALTAQLELGLGAIGGKDSMSGSFENIDVPPTLISFALGIAAAGNVISNTAEKAGQKFYRYSVPRDEYGMPNLSKAAVFLRELSERIEKKQIEFATIALQGGAATAIIKSCIGNGLGFDFASQNKDMFTPQIGDIILSTTDGEFTGGLEYLGETTDSGSFDFDGQTITNAEAIAGFRGVFDKVFPTELETKGTVGKINYYDKRIIFAKNKVAKPRVLIPAFPGTNCELDTAKKFIEAGAETDIFVVKNLKPNDIAESVRELEKRIKNSNIIAFPGGFSGGDEPDGSGKFIATTFRNDILSNAVHDMLYNKDGLIIGICNGFQALVKLGLLPNGRIAPMNKESATLTFNEISRHVSQMAYIKVISTMSPWMSGVKAGEIYSVAVSHGEGKFVATDKELRNLIANGQIATRYVDLAGNETMQFPYNPNGSLEAIEGIFSPDGRVFGKMGHSERSGQNLFKNVPSPSDMNIFVSGVRYFK